MESLVRNDLGALRLVPGAAVRVNETYLEAAADCLVSRRKTCGLSDVLMRCAEYVLPS